MLLHPCSYTENQYIHSFHFHRIKKSSVKNPTYKFSCSSKLFPFYSHILTSLTWLNKFDFQTSIWNILNIIVWYS
ncbi:hypothetical protein C1646_716020 [Rhizophagus diaphanus]|nr:hypothetical protein C1646_716020 [Rhizophagus diaphanus] [Rhizophagus sp. MUCL 43196]